MVIGSSGHQFVDCIDWDFEIFPNFLDYNVIVVNVRSLGDTTLSNISYEKKDIFLSLLIKFIYHRGSLIILTDRLRKVEQLTRSGYVSNYFWSPLRPEMVPEVGDTIEISTDRFLKYLSNFKRWNFYFAGFEWNTQEYLNFIGNGKSDFFIEPLAKNRCDIPLSLSIKWGGFDKKPEDYQSYINPLIEESYEEVPTFFGEVVFLPLIETLDSRKTVNFVLEDLIGCPQTSLPPIWATDIEFDSLTKAKTDINLLKGQIERLAAELQRLEKGKELLEEYKKLLYVEGHELEEIFKRCLKDLGGTIVPAQFSNEEYGLQYKGILYPVEVKGISKSAALTHLRQLIDYLLIYEDKTGQKGKGILLVNPWRNLPVDQRNTGEKPSFPPNVIERAIAMNITLISSVDFFQIYCDFLSGKEQGEMVLDMIVNGVGLIKF